MSEDDQGAQPYKQTRETVSLDKNYFKAHDARKDSEDDGYEDDARSYNVSSPLSFIASFFGSPIFMVGTAAIAALCVIGGGGYYAALSLGWIQDKSQYDIYAPFDQANIVSPSVVQKDLERIRGGASAGQEGSGFAPKPEIGEVIAQEFKPPQPQSVQNNAELAEAQAKETIAAQEPLKAPTIEVAKKEDLVAKPPPADLSEPAKIEQKKTAPLAPPTSKFSKADSPKTLRAPAQPAQTQSAKKETVKIEDAVKAETKPAEVKAAEVKTVEVKPSVQDTVKKLETKKTEKAERLTVEDIGLAEGEVILLDSEATAEKLAGQRAPEVKAEVLAALKPIPPSKKVSQSDAVKNQTKGQVKDQVSEDVVGVKKEGPKKTSLKTKEGYESALQEARAALKAGKARESITFFNDLYKENASDVRVLMGLAVAQQLNGYTESAVTTYEALLEIDPDNADAMVNMISILKKENPSWALRRLRVMAEKHPKNPAIASQIGLLNAQLGNYQDAQKYLEKASSLDPKNAGHLYNLAIVADRQGGVDRAVKLYEHALQIDAIYGEGQTIPRGSVYDRLSQIRIGG